MSVVREEIFGPVVCAIPFDDDDLDRIARTANDTSYGLAASIWTRDLGIAHKLARRIKAGTVWINTHNFGDPALPKRPLAQRIEIAVEMRRIHSADDGRVHVRVAECKAKNELHRRRAIEQVVNMRPLPPVPLHAGLLFRCWSTLGGAATDNNARSRDSCFGYRCLMLPFDR
jgi:Aldehyde dehydrogenase family